MPQPPRRNFVHGAHFSTIRPKETWFTRVAGAAGRLFSLCVLPGKMAGGVRTDVLVVPGQGSKANQTTERGGGAGMGMGVGGVDGLLASSGDSKIRKAIDADIMPGSLQRRIRQAVHPGGGAIFSCRWKSRGGTP